MKLEIKHLAPYLPYRLKIIGNTHGEIQVLSCVTETSVNIEGRSFQYGMWADIFDIKPIFRPLNDLKDFKKRIDVGDGEGLFTPLNRLLFNSYFNIDVMSDADKIEFVEILTDIEIGASYDDISTLISWHFDVFGLIDKGLAIDINTLQL